MKIAIIGAGNMGGAIVRGLCKGTRIESKDIRVSDVSTINLDMLRSFDQEIITSNSNEAVVNEADIIILAVKPWLVEVVAQEIKNKIDYQRQIIVSIAAGIEFNKLSDLFDKKATMFRVIPNTGIDVLQSVTNISSYNASEEQTELIISVFEELGKVFVIPEPLLNALMALSSCGIAYAFRYIRASIEGAVEMGINPDMAKQVIIQTLRGAIDLLEKNNSHPEAEIDKVTTPGGYAISGLNEMEANGFTNSIIKGLKASMKK